MLAIAKNFTMDCAEPDRKKIKVDDDKAGASVVAAPLPRMPNQTQDRREEGLLWNMPKLTRSISAPCRSLNDEGFPMRMLLKAAALVGGDPQDQRRFILANSDQPHSFWFPLTEQLAASAKAHRLTSEWEAGKVKPTHRSRRSHLPDKKTPGKCDAASQERVLAPETKLGGEWAESLKSQPAFDLLNASLVEELTKTSISLHDLHARDVVHVNLKDHACVLGSDVEDRARALPTRVESNESWIEASVLGVQPICMRDSFSAYGSPAYTTVGTHGEKESYQLKAEACDAGRCFRGHVKLSHTIQLGSTCVMDDMGDTQFVLKPSGPAFVGEGFCELGKLRVEGKMADAGKAGSKATVCTPPSTQPPLKLPSHPAPSTFSFIPS